MMRAALVRLAVFSGVTAMVVLLSGPAAAAPAITSVAPRGLQIGHTTTLVITGTDLPADAQLVSGLPIASQTVKPGAKANQIQLEVTLDEQALPGLYALRVAGANGISSPVVVGVDRLPQLTFTATLDELPVALHGTVGGAQVLKASLAGKKDQRLVIDVEAQRLGSGLKPVVRLYDPRGTQIAWSPPRVVIGGDARIEAVLPADGSYSIELQDQLFRPVGSGIFRLKIGDLQFADLALPLGVAAGSKQNIQFASASLPSGAELDASTVVIPGEAAAPLPPTQHFTGARPRIAISDFPELVEASPAGGSLQELPPAPVAISGVLAAAGEEDKYLLAVKPGQKLRLEVASRQFGSPLDAVLSLHSADGGKQLASGDDRPRSSDPQVDYTVPEGVSQVRFAVKDLVGRGGREFVYRVVVQETSRPDFSLSLAADRINVPSGGAQVVPVQVARANYNGPIELSLEGQPSGLALQGQVIPPGATIGLLTLSADGVSPQAGMTRLIGRAAEAQPAVLRAATFGEVPGSRYQPQIRAEIGLAVTRPSPIGLAWLPGDSDQLYLGGKLPARVKFTRAEGTKGKIRVGLLSSQPVPKKTVKQGMQDKVVDDVDRMLRLEGDTTFGEGQSEATVNILVPGDLARQPWDLVLTAELLSADGKNVVTSLAAPVRTLSPVAPFTLALRGPSEAEGKAGAGDAGKLAGKIERVAGYNQPVIVTLDNLPRGYVAPQVLVPAGKDEFELPLTFAFGSKAGPLKGAKLVALSAPQTARSVKSNAVDVAVQVAAGEKPMAEPPKEVFEDDEQFITMLTEGNGRAIPDQRDKYSGTYSLRVTPDQKYNANLPNLNVKIRENPGPGEYRYIRFAWKKLQGGSICLQLAHDGKFGPGGSEGREGASFRYHAGSGECFGASLLVSDRLGRQFEVVTRDLFHDFGEFTLTGLGFAPIDPPAALFDHIYLARQLEDFSLIKTPAGATEDE